MPNKEEITASLRLSGYLDWVAEGNLLRFPSKLHKLRGSRLLMEWPEPCMCEMDAKHSGFYASPTAFEQIRAVPPSPQSEISARIMLFNNQVGTVCNSFPNPQLHSGAFSPVIRHHQETQLDGGRKF